MAKFSPEEWQVEQIRLTIFPEVGETQRNAGWWEAITEEAPEESTSNPKKGTSVIHGPFREGKLILNFALDRIDWIFTAAMDEEPSREFPTVGAFREVFTAFAQIGDKWLALGDVPEINRMAFGAVLTHREENRAAAYARVSEYVPIKINPESSDLIYQINLGSDSKTGIDGLRLNRLSKWSAAALRSLELTLGGGGGMRTRVPELVAIRLELDVNTLPGTGVTPLPKAQILGLFHELMSEGERIATEGVVV